MLWKSVLPRPQGRRYRPRLHWSSGNHPWKSVVLWSRRLQLFARDPRHDLTACFPTEIYIGLAYKILHLWIL